MTPLVLTDVEFASTGGVTTFVFGPDSIAALVDALGPYLATKETSPYMTIEEAAEYIRAKRHRIDGLLCARKLKRHYDGRRVLIRRDELDAYLAAQ